MSLDLVRTAEIQRRLAELADHEAKLLPHERAMVADLRAKYATPGATDSSDVHALAVIARNLAIRAGYAMDPARDSGRVIGVVGRRGGSTPTSTGGGSADKAPRQDQTEG